MTAASCSHLLRRTNIALLGAPGSGKGSYGRLLAKRWGLELVTVSDVLRNKRPQLMQQQAQSGKLLDDQTVSDALLEHLSQRYYRHDESQINNDSNHDTSAIDRSFNASGETISVLVDGFPRTLHQVTLMEQQWPPELKISLAIHLDVPVDVCQQKLLGRRYCTKCGGNYNTSHVQQDGFHLPPTLPDTHVMVQSSLSSPTVDSGASNTSNIGTTSTTTPAPCCDPTIHWSIRDDDTLEVVQQRLHLHSQHIPPIVQHYESKRSIFHFSPYMGWADVDRFHHSLEQWLEERIAWKRNSMQSPESREQSVASATDALL